ncbi:hypothetical protein Hanom_Chr10g00898621 [Helianthus anomalus]
MHHGKRRTSGDDSDGGFEHDGLWQREILMRDKCQPLDLSGVIYYDRDGKRMDEFPMRSPRASLVPGYMEKFDSVPPVDRIKKVVLHLWESQKKNIIHILQ